MTNVDWNTTALTPWIGILIGVVVLCLGRRLFWLVVAGFGFIIAGTMCALFLRDLDPWIVAAVCIGMGVLGGFLALLFQRFTVLLVGFIAGGYIVAGVVTWWEGQTYELIWLYFLVGGVVGAVLMKSLFEWALIFLSSLTGAALIVEPWSIDPRLQPLVFIGLLFVGLLIQCRAMKQSNNRTLATA